MVTTTIGCAVCGALIDPRTTSHYQADSGRRWCLSHGVVYGPADQVAP